MSRSLTLAQLAEGIGADLKGDADCIVKRVDTLDHAGAGDVTFLFNRKYRKFLEVTHASAVILGPEDVGACPVNALVMKNPYLGYARAASLLDPQAGEYEAGIHPSACVDPSAVIDSSATIGAHVVIAAGVHVAARAFIGAGCVIGRDVRIGPYSRLLANATICHGCTIGSRCLIHPGAVLGADGFGLARDGDAWLKVPQLGAVQVGDDVEIGANTTIDRGALKDTMIGNGVKLDNQIQIGHNVSIGEHTAIAGCAGISGSTVIGRRCMIAGGVGIAGHLEIADDVTITGMSLVTKSIRKAGIYSSSWPAEESLSWRRKLARFRRLGKPGTS